MRLALLSITALITLAACAPDKPWLMEDSNTETGALRIMESRHVVKKPLAEFSDADINDAAYIYNRQGAGPVYVAVAYDDSNAKGVDHDTAARAQAIGEGLSRAGITNKIIVTTVQMDAAIPVVVVAFDMLEAKGPADCETRPDIYHAALANNDAQDAYNYKIGCGVKNMMAAQIADPRDLEGHAGLSPAQAERVSNVINNDYRKGETHTFVPSYIISELAGKGS